MATKKPNSARKSAKKPNTSITKSAKKKSNATRTTSSRALQTAQSKKTVTRSTEGKSRVAVSTALFNNASSVDITPKGISVTHSAARSTNGARERAEVKRTLPQSPEAMAAVNAALNKKSREGKVKRIHVEFSDTTKKTPSKSKTGGKTPQKPKTSTAGRKSSTRRKTTSTGRKAPTRATSRKR